MESNRWTFRKAQTSDAGTVHQIHVECLRKVCSLHYSQQQINNWTGRLKVKDYVEQIQGEDDFVLIEDNRLSPADNNRAVGFGQVGRYTYSTTDQRFSPTVNFEIKKCYISPRVKRQGAGRAMITELQRLAVNRAGCMQTCIALEATLNAIPFYKSCGYKVTNEDWLHLFEGDSEYEDFELEAVILEKEMSSN